MRRIVAVASPASRCCCELGRLVQAGGGYAGVAGDPAGRRAAPDPASDPASGSGSGR